MNRFLADLRHAFRLYRRTPISTSIAIVVLAVAIAFVGAFLSLYVDLILRPDPGFEEGRLLATIGQNRGTSLAGMPFETIDRMDDEMASIEAAAAITETTTLAGPERDELVTGMVSVAFFGGLRPRLALGRAFLADDHAPEAEPVVVLSHRYWQERFNGDRRILGNVLALSRAPALPYSSPPSDPFAQVEPEQDSARFRIVGVMAETLPGVGSIEPAIWVPLERAWRLFAGVPESLPSAIAGTYVRRVPGTSLTAVINELRARYAAPDAMPFRIPGTELDAIGGIVSNISIQRDAKRQLDLFLGVSVLLALVAAANVSLFLLARAPGRRRELGIRMSVGATIRGLTRQLATEGALLVVVSAALGLFGSIWLSTYLRNIALLREAEWRDVTLLDWRVLGLTIALMVVLALFVSLSPVLGIKRLGIAAASRQAKMRASLAQRLAGTAQMAVAGTLGGAALAFGFYLGALMLGDAGYKIADRYVVDGPADVLGLNRERIFVEFARRREAIEAIPSVTAVAFGSPVPGGVDRRLPVRIPRPDNPADVVEANLGSVENRFVELLGLELLSGRAPAEGDTAGVLVNRTLARALWGRDDVVGERLPGNIRWGVEGADVIGVLKDLSYEHPSAAVPPYVFSTLGSLAAPMTTVIEAKLSAADLQQELNRLVATGALEVKISNLRPLETMRNELLAADRARSILTITAAILAVVLVAFGFYGTHRYLVTAGRREYAIRASIGAGPRAIGRLVVGRGLLMCLPGLLVAGVLSFITVAWLRGGFIGEDVSPLVVAISVVTGLTSLLLAATLAPAREAARMQPASLLRQD